MSSKEDTRCFKIPSSISRQSVSDRNRSVRLKGHTLESHRRNTSILNSTCASLATSSELFTAPTILCLVKGRGKAAPETGIAFMNLGRNIVNMSQFCDDQVHSHLMTKVFAINPTQIVVAQTLRESPVLEKMFEKLEKTFPRCKIEGIPRRYMSEGKGREYVRLLSSKDSSDLDIVLNSKVYAILAVAGLLSYVEESVSVYITPHTLRMVYYTGENCMLLDHGTAVNLEILRSTSIGSQASSASLYSCLDHTRTLTGARLLRSTLLEPPTDADLIVRRYNAVEELINDPEMRISLQNALGRFPDIEKSITHCVLTPRYENKSTAETKLRSVLSLKTALDLLPSIAGILNSSEAILLVEIRQQLADEGLDRILRLIISKLNYNAMITSGFLSMKGQLVFAVKQGLDGKLDAMRVVYNSLIDEIQDVVQLLSESYQLALKSAYTTQRGFHVTMRVPKSSQPPGIPQQFIKVTQSKGVYSMTTDQLVILNARISECLDSIYNLSNRIVTQLLCDINSDIHCLNSVVNAIGNLDLLLSFASVSRQPDYVRPDIGGMFALKNARHPVAEACLSDRVVPNDLYLSEDANFMIITGANNSGKSFYLRTIGVMQIMAQAGCYVPADFATFRVSKQLFSRIGGENSADTRYSSFTLEMKEIAFVLKQECPTALIIIDEMCRGTGEMEGLDICFAMCQKLMQTKAFTLFATHFKELCQLEGSFPNCNNYCFATNFIDDDTGNRNDHKLRKGVTNDVRYGLQLAANMNFPEKVIKDAYTFADTIEGVTHETLNCSEVGSSVNSAVTSRLYHRIHSEIQLISKHQGSMEAKKAALCHLQQKYREELRQIKSTGSTEVGQDYEKNDIKRENHNLRQNVSLSQRGTNATTGSSQSTQSRRSYFTQQSDLVTKDVITGEIGMDDGGSGMKLVNYSLSPIDVSGSINKLHSYISTPERIVKASTRNYRDPNSSKPTISTNHNISSLNGTVTQSILGSDFLLKSETTLDSNKQANYSFSQPTINCESFETDFPHSSLANYPTPEFSIPRSTKLDGQTKHLVKDTRRDCSSKSGEEKASSYHTCSTESHIARVTPTFISTLKRRASQTSSERFRTELPAAPVHKNLKLLEEILSQKSTTELKDVCFSAVKTEPL